MNETLNCRKCGSHIFINAVDRGTNNINSVTQSIGCPKCESRWLIGRTIKEALRKWSDFQNKEDLPLIFNTPCGSITRQFVK